MSMNNSKTVSMKRSPIIFLQNWWKSDTGYPQHQEMRVKIREMWLAKKELLPIIDRLREINQ